MTQDEISAILNRTRVGDVLRVLYKHPHGGILGYEARIHHREINSDGSVRQVGTDEYMTYVAFGRPEPTAQPCWHLYKGMAWIVVEVKIL